MVTKINSNSPSKFLKISLILSSFVISRPSSEREIFTISVIPYAVFIAFGRAEPIPPEAPIIKALQIGLKV